MDIPFVAAPEGTMDIPFVQARYYKAIPDDQPREIQDIVMHTIECPEKPKTAIGVANMFHVGPVDQHGNPRPASAHLCIDAQQVVQCVRYQDVAYGAPGTNRNGIHIEHAGYAAQTPEQWKDDFSVSELCLSAQVVAGLCKEYEIPVAFVDAEGLLAGVHGITTHAEVSKACLLANQRGLTSSDFYNTANPHKPMTDHSDPGKYFPMDAYLEGVASFT